MNETGGKKRRGRRTLFILVIVIVVVGAFALRFLDIRRGESLASIRSVQEQEGKPVETAVAERGDIRAWTTLAGTVEGATQTPVTSTNALIVVDVPVNEGDAVKAGDVIIRLEKTAPNPMVHSYDRSKALYDDALADAKRMRNLHREGAISEQALEKAEMALEVARADLENARVGTDLVAAHDGVVMSIGVEPGDLADTHEPLAWIARTDSARIVFQAGSRQALMLRRGQRAEWRDAATGNHGEGYVSKLDLAADPKTHLLEGEAIFGNAGGLLMPGLLVSFDVLSVDRSGVIRIPRRALVDAPGGFRVFVLSSGPEEETRAGLRAVETGFTGTDEVEIVSGIEPGERVVVFGQSALKDGDLVKVVGGEVE
ncbi:MAG: efflux RND transporter periplasmic adaptor subunit [Candidatus Krumholzibacteriota bacterium]|nr:efflux RND transporter periplasmic adaptor subunit [Candidatus Krumholzibacteriota bacterium]